MYTPISRFEQCSSSIVTRLLPIFGKTHASTAIGGLLETMSGGLTWKVVAIMERIRLELLGIFCPSFLSFKMGSYVVYGSVSRRSTAIKLPKYVINFS